jgi:hypothetical protein
VRLAILDTSKLRLKHLFSVFLGVIFSWLSSRFWGVYAVDNSITNWLVDEFGKNDQANIFYTLAGIHDFIINLALAAPVAILLRLVVGENDWLSVFLTVLGLHVAMFWGTEFSDFDMLIRYWRFWINLATTIAVVPLAYLGINALWKRQASI